MLLNRNIGAAESSVLIGVFLLFMFINVLGAVKRMKEKDQLSLTSEQTDIIGAAEKEKTLDNDRTLIAGAAGIAAGANLLIDSVSAAAAKLSVSEQIISLTVVALGTSLPELLRR